VFLRQLGALLFDVQADMDDLPNITSRHVANNEYAASGEVSICKKEGD